MISHLHTCTVCKHRFECWCGQEPPALYRDCTRCSELKINADDAIHAHAMGVAIE